LSLATAWSGCSLIQELFYLLDDMDSGERDGVVTVASLAVELQAGGLTEEHVEYVCQLWHHVSYMVILYTVGFRQTKP